MAAREVGELVLPDALAFCLAFKGQTLVMHSKKLESSRSPATLSAGVPRTSPIRKTTFGKLLGFPAFASTTTARSASDPLLLVSAVVNCSVTAEPLAGHPLCEEYRKV
ncbi:hypothetical protein BH18ACT12_BH18ACT12_10700 [soil metagenome]